MERSNMRKLLALVCVLFLANTCACAAEKFKVQVTECSDMTTISADGRLFLDIFAKVILPNGDHASLMCGDKRCAKIEPLAPEKSSPDATKCFSLGSQHTCTTYNMGEYWATREGNWLTIYAANGKLTFKITGSW
jgi:hypothetical protein